jgi:hypothetical protein
LPARLVLPRDNHWPLVSLGIVFRNAPHPCLVIAQTSGPARKGALGINIPILLGMNDLRLAVVPRLQAVTAWPHRRTNVLTNSGTV